MTDKAVQVQHGKVDVWKCARTVRDGLVPQSSIRFE